MRTDEASTAPRDHSVNLQDLDGFFISIKFILNFSYNFFENIFQGNDTVYTSKFISN